MASRSCIRGRQRRGEGGRAGYVWVNARAGTQSVLLIITKTESCAGMHGNLIRLRVRVKIRVRVIMRSHAGLIIRH